MVVSLFVGLVELVVEQLRVVDAEAAVLPAHAHYLVDHVELVFRDLSTLELVDDHVSHGLILTIRDVQVGPFWASSELCRLLFLQIL